MLNNSNHLLEQTLGTCTLKRLIGRGGMGAVYLAQQSRPRRTVAVKVLLPNLIEPGPRDEFLARFRREADAIAALDHVNIMPIYEYGEQGETAYLVMPYVMGGTLRERLEAQRVLPMQDIVSIIEQTAAGLDCAHALGIIHRDLKPGNILFHADGRILIADFGLAKMLKDATEQESAVAALTSAGSIIGTPEYLSPEQGTGNPIDYRTDVYSFGVVLYQMLAGRVPFVGSTPVAVAIKHAIEEPLPVSHFNPAVPRSIEAVVMKALAKAPEQRFSSAGEMARALRQAASNEHNATLWKAPDRYTSSDTIVPTTDSSQPEQAAAELQTVLPIEEEVATVSTDNQHSDDKISSEREATHITQPSQENHVMQEKVAALPTLMMASNNDEFHTSPTEEAPLISTQEEPIQSFPTVVTQAEATEENEFELEPKVFYQEVKLPTSLPETERPQDSSVMLADLPDETIQHQPMSALNTPVKPMRRTRSRPQSTWMVLIGSLLTLILIGGGIAVYLHSLPTPSVSPQGRSKTVAISKVTRTSSSQHTPTASVTTPQATTSSVAAPKAAISAGVPLYSTPHPFTSCDTQGGHWADTAAGTHVTCSANGSEMVNTAGHLTFTNLNKLAGNQNSWPGQSFVVQVDVSINPNSHNSAFGIDFQPQMSDSSQEYFAYMLNPAGQWTFTHYDAQGNILDTLITGQLTSPISTKLTLDISVEGTSYAVYINGQDTTARAETGSQYTNKIVGLAVDANADVTFSNFAIYNALS